MSNHSPDYSVGTSSIYLFEFLFHSFLPSPNFVLSIANLFPQFAHFFSSLLIPAKLLAIKIHLMACTIPGSENINMNNKPNADNQ